MSKVKQLILLIVLSLLVAAGQASSTTNSQTENVPITLTAGTQHSGNDRSSSIYASINGHTLSIAFTESFGDVSIKVLDESYVTIDLMTTPTPTGCQVYIPTSGRYILVITFPDGDEYSGDFEVSD